MRTFTFSAQTLRLYFKEHIIATMNQLKNVLGTSVDMTVYRKLCELSYHTSYSHQGKYYTLDELTDFNPLGLWTYGESRFSRYGTLVRTVEALILHADKGYSLAELRELVGVSVKEVLLQLYRQSRVHREEIGCRYIYFSTDSSIQRKQHLSRLEDQPRLSIAEQEIVLVHEVRASIILFFSLLDEKQRRLYAGLESLRIGHGGDNMIAGLLHLDAHTIAKGRRELQQRDMEIERIRRKGAGRHSIKKNT